MAKAVHAAIWLALVPLALLRGVCAGTADLELAIHASKLEVGALHVTYTVSLTPPLALEVGCRLELDFPPSFGQMNSVCVESVCVLSWGY